MAQHFRPDYFHYRKPLVMERNEIGVLQVRQDFTWIVDSSLMRFSAIYGYLSLWIRGDQVTRYSLNNLTIRDVMVGNQSQSKY